MSQEPRRVDPSVIAGAKPAPFPAFVEPCHPTLRQELPSGAGWVHEVKFDGYRVQAHLRRGAACHKRIDDPRHGHRRSRREVRSYGVEATPAGEVPP